MCVKTEHSAIEFTSNGRKSNSLAACKTWVSRGQVPHHTTGVSTLLYLYASTSISAHVALLGLCFFFLWFIATLPLRWCTENLWCHAPYISDAHLVSLCNTRLVLPNSSWQSRYCCWQASILPVTCIHPTGNYKSINCHQVFSVVHLFCIFCCCLVIS